MSISDATGAGGYAVPPAPVTTHTALGPIEHTDSGTGRALLALHGGMGGYDQSWLLARALLGERPGFRTLGLSRPGYLGTAQSLGHTPETQADLYARLLDTLGIERALVAAVSAGGPSAIQFALRHPDRCDGLILVSAATGPLETAAEFLARLRKMRWICRVPGLIPLLRRRAMRDPLARALPSITDRDLAARTLAHPAAGPLLSAVLLSTFSHTARRLPGTMVDTRHYRAMPAPPCAQLAVPVLAIHGDADPVVPVSHARRVLAAPRATALILPGGGHMALFSHLDDIRAAVDDFLPDTGGPG
jgi:pimeloyl-ACP methyl ester carboxylesterase